MFLRLCALASGLAVTILSPTILLADTPPKPKAGLWEVRVVSGAMLALVGKHDTYKQCVDGTIALEELTNTPGSLCDLKWKKVTDDRIETEMHCKLGGTATEGKALIIGDFNSRVRIEKTDTVIEARWTGACERGQQPGSATLPDGKVVAYAPFMSQLPFMMK